MKWIAFVAIVLAAAMAARAYQMDFKSSFDDGSFLVEMLIIAVAVALFLFGIITLAVIGWNHV